MDTSDDPVTVGILGLGVYSAVQASKMGDGRESIGAKQAKTTAEPTVQLSEAAKRNRRLAASSLTKQWTKPKLGTEGLLGA